MVVASHEPVAARGGLWRHVLWRRQLRARTESHARSDSRRRTVRERLRGERQHPGVGVSIAGFQRGLHRLVPVEGVDVVHHRHAQPEGRLSAHADDRRSDVHDEQPEPDLPLQQRRAESADPVDFAVGEQCAGRLGGSLRPGAVDPPAPDAAGRVAVRSSAELVPRAAGGAVEIPADAHQSFRRRVASTATRTSRRGWAWRTTCSELARRRSR